MTLRIAIIASLFSFGCAKDEDSGGAAGANACDALVAEYCACDCIDEAACTAYEDAIAASSGDEAVCAASQTAWDAAGGCDSICIAP